MSKKAISHGEAGIGDFEPTADLVRNGVEEISSDLRRLLDLKPVRRGVHHIGAGHARQRQSSHRP